MARERFSLVSEEEKMKGSIESRILSKEITSANIHTFSEEEQKEIKNVLFNMASKNVDPNKGASALEFTLFGFMRIATKRMQGLSLTEQEQEIEASLNRMMEMHQLSNDSVDKSEWLFDYMGYAEAKEEEILRNRKEHIARKQQVIG